MQLFYAPDIVPPEYTLSEEAIFFIFNFIDSAYDYGMQPA